MSDFDTASNQTKSTSKKVAAQAAILFFLLFLAGAAAVFTEWLCYVSGQQEYGRIAALAVETRPADESPPSASDFALPVPKPEAPVPSCGTPAFFQEPPPYSQGLSDPLEYNPADTGQAQQSQIAAVNFSVLQAGNPDCAAWIEIPGTRISYPVMYRAGDGAFYLTHTYELSETKAGAIHIDGACEGIDSRNLLIYGHTLLDGSMFTDLHRYKNPRFYQQHPFIYLHLPDGTVRRYLIAACVLTQGEQESFYLWDFKDDFSAQAYYDQFAEQALYPTGVSVTADSQKQTLVLSTCTRRIYRRLIFAVEQ